MANNNQFFSDQVERINSDLKDRVRPKKKSADFYSDLVKDGVELLRQSIFDNLAKRTSSADWLMKFFKLMPKADREAWRLLDECLVEECVPLVEDMLERQGLIGVLSAKQ